MSSPFLNVSPFLSILGMRSFRIWRAALLFENGTSSVFQSGWCLNGQSCFFIACLSLYACLLLAPHPSHGSSFGFLWPFCRNVLTLIVHSITTSVPVMREFVTIFPISSLLHVLFRILLSWVVFSLIFLFGVVVTAAEVLPSWLAPSFFCTKPS